jgi:hypothetical protein
MSVVLPLVAAGIVFVAIYVVTTLRSGTLTKDDAGFVRGVVPARLLRFVENTNSSGQSQA